MRSYTIPIVAAQKYHEKLLEIIGSCYRTDGKIFQASTSENTAWDTFSEDEAVEDLEDFLVSNAIPFDRYQESYEGNQPNYRIYRPSENGAIYDEERQVIDDDPTWVIVNLYDVQSWLAAEQCDGYKIAKLNEFAKTFAFPPYTKIEDIQ